MNNDVKSIIKSKAKIFSEPIECSILETEGLFGENFHIEKIQNNWVFGTLLSDNYKGWIKRNKLGKKFISTHKVSVLRSHIFTSPSSKASSILYVSLGSRLRVLKKDDFWAEIDLSPNQLNKGYIPSNHINKIDCKVVDWVRTAELFIGTPYVWGGRSSYGIDCSALIQISLDSFGIQFPRNSSQQFEKLNNNEIEFTALKRGDLVYWKGHIAIIINNKDIIHANGFNMSVNIECLDNVYSRIGKGTFLKIK